MTAGATTSNAHGVTLGSTSSSVATKTGPKITIKNGNRLLVSVTKTTNSTCTTAYLEDILGNTLAVATYSGNVATFNYPLQNGLTYAITNNAGGSNWVWNYNSTPTFPYSGTDLNWVGTRDNGVDSTTNLVVLTDITTSTETLITPSLPTGWVECTGQTISDADSPINGKVVPNLNNFGLSIINIIRIK